MTPTNARPKLAHRMIPLGFAALLALVALAPGAAAGASSSSWCSGDRTRGTPNGQVGAAACYWFVLDSCSPGTVCTVHFEFWARGWTTGSPAGLPGSLVAASDDDAARWPTCAWGQNPLQYVTGGVQTSCSVSGRSVGSWSVFLGNGCQTITLSGGGAEARAPSGPVTYIAVAGPVDLRATLCATAPGQAAWR